ncbi:tetratricopeptide repeat-containing sensor histidine kinase [Winogradskyella sp.]|uniref:tetratricopeptide repeat-containing sensor histidine kinase n=1 Tax=Winogradskyella sp. TaxID=1883156 RepID=UPI003AB46D07
MRTKITSLIILFFLLLFFSCNFQNVKSIETAENDSIQKWITQSKKNSLTHLIRKTSLVKAHKKSLLSKSSKNKNRNLTEIAYQYYKLSDTLKFIETNKKALQLATISKDSFAIGDAHWNFATYYNGIEVYDSAYYHFNIAQRYFGTINKSFYKARMLIGKSFVKRRFRDYIGGEILTTKAISIFEASKNYAQLYEAYNQLALAQKGLMQFDKALVYHNKAIEYLKASKNKSKKLVGSFNNIGLVYQAKGDYQNAIVYFKKALDNYSSKNSLNEYARVIDNLSYNMFRNNETLKVKSNLLKALHIRDSLNNKSGTVISKLHLSEYYLSSNQIEKAFNYAKEANLIAKRIKNNRDYLNSLKLLSKIDPKNAKKYLTIYIKHNDSLLNVERKIQNKFTRIEYETDGYIKETELLEKKNTWIIIIACFVLLTILLLYFLKIQKARNDKLYFEIEQQKSNEEIYGLTIKQQANFEKEKEKERNRISADLHDGVLGKLFALRLNFGFLGHNFSKEKNKEYEVLLKELQDIEKEIRLISHGLKSSLESPKLNFLDLIKSLIEKTQKISSINFSLVAHKNIAWEELDEIVKVNLYRIIQESLQNIIRHSHAKNTKITFNSFEKNLILTIQDDGIGFKLSKTNIGIGLKNIKSRTQNLKGIFEIISKPNIGTIIKLSIPK